MGNSPRKWSLWSIREAINLKLYDHKTRVIRTMRIMSFGFSLLALLALIYYHGYNTSEEERTWIALIIRSSLGFYVVKYFVRILFDFHPRQFFRDTWLEGILILLILLNGISRFLFNFPLITRVGEWVGILSLDNFLLLFIQGYLLVMVAVELGKASQIMPSLGISPPKLLIISFVFLIAVGTGLLMLPEMASSGKPTPLKDAMFTSISASCVTGLVVQDTATFFSFKGHVVILLLMQLGGLNIITFASLFALLNRSGMGIKHQSLLQQNFNIESLDQAENLFTRIFSFSLLLEGIGTALIYCSWGDVEFTHRGAKLFSSLFHSISAFNNAGFSLFSNGLATEGVQQLPPMHLIIALLIIMGSLGFPAMSDLFSLSRVKERISKPWVHLRVGTKVSVYSTLGLIMIGFLIFLLSEWDGVLGEMSLWERIHHAFFQSVTTRTAGFNTIDIGALGVSTLLLFFVLMFIGASPGSTGGGIKTTTFALVLLSAWTTIRGKQRLELFKSTIPYDLLNKAFSIFLFSLSLIFVGTFVLSYTDGHIPLQQLMFEEISAFCTVGLSTGITDQLSDGGRVVIMLSMFIGRVGTLTLAFALSNKGESTDYKYPKTTMMVG